MFYLHKHTFYNALKLILEYVFCCVFQKCIKINIFLILNQTNEQMYTNLNNYLSKEAV